jgi:hypothetical protein
MSARKKGAISMDEKHRGEFSLHGDHYPSHLYLWDARMKDKYQGRREPFLAKLSDVHVRAAHISHSMTRWR